MRTSHSSDLIVLARRSGAIILTVLISIGATHLFIEFAGQDGFSLVDILRCALIAISTAWLAWGAVLSLFGLFYVPEPTPRLAPDAPLAGRTIVLIPVYNENPVAIFARLAAMDESLCQLGVARSFDFAVLSDTTRDDIAGLEAHWFVRLLDERNARGRFFYRRRTVNTGKKAGNIEDFLARSGAAYEYALILDADSLMEGATILEMARRLEADPGLGLLQSPPAIIRARSFFGRTMQFAATCYSPVFARGVAMLQGNTGPFWGHNAIVRTRAFAASCGLPPLSGAPPFGGPVLSHDYVEAALLARAGWRVRLDPDLEASFEEGPQNIIEHAKRDRRWCQGNLQHARLLVTPRLRPWSRLIFAQGIMAYIASPLWLLFLVTSIAAPFFAPPPNYFPEPHFPFPVFPTDDTLMAILLVVSITCLLVLPKLLIFLKLAFAGHTAGFGGSARALASILVEIVFSSLTAPLMLWFQSRAVLEVLLGVDRGWPATDRGGRGLSLAEGWAATRGIVITGTLMLVFAFWASHDMLIWLVPIAGPMVFAPWIVSASSRPAAMVRQHLLFTSTPEVAPAAVMALQTHMLDLWTSEPAHADATIAASPRPLATSA